jgi:hypothetical protein
MVGDKNLSVIKMHGATIKKKVGKMKYLWYAQYTSL